MKAIQVNNNSSIAFAAIPVLDYGDFLSYNTGLIAESQAMHCVNYYGIPEGKGLRLICCMADDLSGKILLTSSRVARDMPLSSLTAVALCFEKFEREIHENFGLPYCDHPWLKPVRYPFDRADLTQTIANYPFYSIDSEELHEVGVGPIHAGVIEPGHFRFICNGEQILHLEIQLGYQHRGVENLFSQMKGIEELSTLAEGIAGDTVVGHTVTFAHVWESLSGFVPSRELDFSRTLALELERMAIHTGDMSALCTDIAYQLGSAVFGRLRTPIVNFMQEWCGNRLSKGLIRPATNRFRFTEELGTRLEQILDVYEPEFTEMCQQLFRLPSALSRFERTGVVTTENAREIGVVGMAARTSGIKRDIRESHPDNLYGEVHHEAIIKRHGDVYSRIQLRKFEILQSLGYVRMLLKMIPEEQKDNHCAALSSHQFAIALTEGWRGEICHCALTGQNGELIHYKIKDPSFHNWMALALAVRNNEISDFPICNKSFNLSYCGHDL
ncbi:MAG: hypothetical protein LWW85_12250 [Marinilabiliales bacterium]|nr:hypothetical protein [Marinilabiliales bacterium]